MDEVNSDPSSSRKSLENEVEALRIHCQESEARTAGLLDDLHQCQKEMIAHQDVGKKFEKEVKHLKEYLKVMF